MEPAPNPGWTDAERPQRDNPMAVHLKVIGVLEVVWGSLVAVVAFAILFVTTLASLVTGNSDVPSFVPGIVASFGLLFALLFGALALVAILGGLRLMAHRRSGRTLTYVSAALAILNFPLGTAFGIYAFVILSRPETDQLLVSP